MFDTFDLELFGPAFFTGFCFALYLPVLGCYLRLRDETLAALAYAQVGAAGALGAMALNAPLGLGGMVASLGAVTIKQSSLSSQSNPEINPAAQRSTRYALILILAWGVGVLLTSNLPLAERLGHALFDGQLLLSGSEHPVLTAAVCLGGLLVLRQLSQRLLLAQILPSVWQLQSRHWRWLHIGFDLLAAGSIAIATMHLGVMATFALLLVCPWLAFLRAARWLTARWLAVLSGVFAYVLAFGLALLLDQPFGPVLVLTLMLIAIFSNQIRGASPTSSTANLQ